MIRTWIFLSAAIFVALPYAAFANDDATKLAIQARYDQINTATAAKDWAARRAIYASDYKSTDIDGKSSTADDEIAGLEKALPYLSSVEVKTTVVSVRQDGDLAHVEQQAEAHSTIKGWFGKTYAVDIKSRSADVWRRVKSTWVIVSATAEQVDVSSDGKSVVHKVKAPKSN